MSDLEAQVGAIFEKMVEATISEMSKLIGVSNSAQPSCTTENPQVPSAKTVMHLSDFMTSLAQEAVVKICNSSTAVPVCCS